ncbi:MAG: acetate--CoA ligase family protein [Candidatus Bathyarchaeia archaeon]
MENPMTGGSAGFDAVFRPGSIAVIGASREPGSVGHETLRNIVESGFPGTVYPVNPRADAVLGLRCYRSVEDLPGPVDLGVVAVPAGVVLEVAEEAGEKGFRNLMVLSAGFKEAGGEGPKREKLLVELCRRHDMRLIGPNCLGLIAAYTPLNASFAPVFPKKGNVAFISQSGALVTSILDWSMKEEIGFSYVVSLGNCADLNETDFIEALSMDPYTRVIAAYIEGVGEGRRFIRVAEEASRRKPVLVIKSGISEAGARAISSHTGSLAGSGAAYKAVFERTGIIQVESVEELFDLARIFSTQPIPRGRNLAVVTNAGGPGIIATDACSKHGLNLAWLSPETISLLRSRLPGEASWVNPVDVLGDASPERYRGALEAILRDRGVDSILVICSPQAVTRPKEIAEEIVKVRDSAAEGERKPIVCAFMGGEAVSEAVRILSENGIPNYPFPERAVKALSYLSRYGEEAAKAKVEDAPSFSVDREAVKAILERAKRENRVNLLMVEAFQILSAYGLKTPPSILAQNRVQAVEAAEEMGYPVALKVASPQILHKTDIGGVKLNLKDRSEVEEAFDEILRNASSYMPEARIIGVVVQKMVEPGREVIVGIHKDPQFGPLIMFGLGGIYVNILREAVFKLAPVTVREALKMIAETKAYPLLRGVRGEPPSDINGLAEAISRVSQLSLDFEEIIEMDINPLFVYEKGKGCAALDAKITVRHERP